MNLDHYGKVILNDQDLMGEPRLNFSESKSETYNENVFSFTLRLTLPINHLFS